MGGFSDGDISPTLGTKTMKTHWLYGRGPNRVIEFIQEIDEETKCEDCIHKKVCAVVMEHRCINYTFGTSEFRGCQGCVHKYTRFDKDPIPCFSCPDFIHIDKLKKM